MDEVNSAGFCKIVECDESHSAAILAVLNDAILNSTAIYDYQPRSQESLRDSNTDEFMGFASYGPFRPWAAYKYTVEHSVYLAKQFRGKGVGKKLLAALIERAIHQDYHVMIGGIDSTNAASIALHEQLGFQRVATMSQVGFKFGRWLDLHFYQLLLPTPRQPHERSS